MLLISDPKYGNTPYLEHCPWLQNFLVDCKSKKIAFVPYTGVSI